MDEVQQFIDQIITDKGYTTLDDDVRAQLREDLTNQLMEQIDRAAINALPEDKAAEFADKLDDPNFTDQDAQQFMAASGVDLERVTVETMLQFRALYLGGAGAPAAETAVNNPASAEA